MISRFKGEYSFLSNFYPCKIEDRGLVFPTLEHAYVARKTVDSGEIENILNIKSAGHVKIYGRTVTMIPEWDIVKVNVMNELLLKKFSDGSELLQKLLDTGTQELVEGNTHGDTFWGQCPLGKGKNMLGKLLMKIRTEKMLFG